MSLLKLYLVALVVVAIMFWAGLWPPPRPH
jgi:hypothetical protein